MSRFSAADVLELPLQERLQLVQEIWSSIAEAPAALELTDEEKQFIEDRLKACRQKPAAASPWREVLARVSSRQN